MSAPVAAVSEGGSTCLPGTTGGGMSQGTARLPEQPPRAALTEQRGERIYV